MLSPETTKIRGAMTGIPGMAFQSRTGWQHSRQEGRVDDTILIREAQSGDATAFEELVRNYDQAVLRLALHITGSEDMAQDIFQDAFLRAYQSLPGFRFQCSFYTWMYRIVTNLCFDYLRRQRRHQTQVNVFVNADGEESEVLDRIADSRPASNPDHELRGYELRRCIVRALQKLSARERLVFELKHYQGMKLRTVADILKTSEGTVKNTLFRATQKLRVALAGMR